MRSSATFHAVSEALVLVFVSVHLNLQFPIFELLRRLCHVRSRYDIIAVKDRTTLGSADLHANDFGNSRGHHIANSRSTEVVKEQPLIGTFTALVFSSEFPHASLHAERPPCPTKIQNRLAVSGKHII